MKEKVPLLRIFLGYVTVALIKKIALQLGLLDFLKGIFTFYHFHIFSDYFYWVLFSEKFTFSCFPDTFWKRWYFHIGCFTSTILVALNCMDHIRCRCFQNKIFPQRTVTSEWDSELYLLKVHVHTKAYVLFMWKEPSAFLSLVLHFGSWRFYSCCEVLQCF